MSNSLMLTQPKKHIINSMEDNLMEEKSDLIVLLKDKDQLEVKVDSKVVKVDKEDSKIIEVLETLETQEWT